MKRLIGQHFLVTIFLMITTSLSAAPASTAPGDTTDASLRYNLEHVAKLRIYLGHQSVGGNLLDGIAQLAAQEGVTIHIQEAPTADKVPANTLGHTYVANNRDPLGKLQAFDQAFGPKASGLDVALLKFCYLDFEAGTDAAALFDRYQSTVAGLRARNPNMTIVHITSPLTTVQTGPKALLKQLMSKAPYGILENLRREEYNALLRRAYIGKEPIFDLALFESTGPDGSKTLVKWQGLQIPVLTALYTDDGGHLNAQSRLHMASKLVAILGTIPAH